MVQLHILEGSAWDHWEQQQKLGVYFVIGVLVVEPHLILKTSKYLVNWVAMLHLLSRLVTLLPRMRSSRASLKVFSLRDHL